MIDIGILERDIYVDKQSGKDFDRPKYQELKKVLREGDILFIKSIDRLGRLRLLGAMEWNLSGIPMGRLRVLSRYASMARAQTIERMNHERRIATLVSFAISFTISAQDKVMI